MIKLIGITGKARSGKDTICDILTTNISAVRYGMADPIKGALSSLLSGKVPEDKEEVIDWLGHSPRAILQELGGGLRNSLSEDIWIRFLERFCDELKELEDVFLVDADSASPLYVVIPDIRYNNEAQYIKDNNGIILRVIREDAKKVREHESEAGISIKYVDHIIDNNGTPEELKEKVNQLLKEGILDD